jgi:cytochrome P450
MCYQAVSCVINSLRHNDTDYMQHECDMGSEKRLKMDEAREARREARRAIEKAFEKCIIEANKGNLDLLLRYLRSDAPLDVELRSLLARWIEGKKPQPLNDLINTLHHRDGSQERREISGRPASRKDTPSQGYTKRNLGGTCRRA